MAWQPKNKIIDTRFLIDRLLETIENKQAEIFEFANPGSGLKPFEAIYNSIEGRVVEVFPALVVIDDRYSTPPYAGDIVQTKWSINLQIALESDNAEALTREARLYEYALRSLLVNLQNSDLFAGGTAKIAQMDCPDSIFDILGQGIKSKYSQVFSMLPEYVIQDSAY